MRRLSEDTTYLNESDKTPLNRPITFADPQIHVRETREIKPQKTRLLSKDYDYSKQITEKMILPMDLLPHKPKIEKKCKHFRPFVLSGKKTVLAQKGNPDLDFWLRKTSVFANDNTPKFVRRRASALSKY